MIRQDYIVRAIEQFAAMIAKVAGLIDKGDLRSAQDSIDRVAQRFLELEPGELTRVSEAELLKRTLRDTPPALVGDKVWMLISALEQTGVVAAARGDGERKRASLHSALGLMFWLGEFERNTPTPGFAPKLENLLFALGDEPLPLNVSLQLMRHYEMMGAFGKAEDVLHALHDSQAGIEFLPRLGEDFYQRLLAKPDSLLAEGNLPRDEVETGLEDWRRAIARGAA